MVVERIIGNAKTTELNKFILKQRNVDFIDIDWFECDKKILRKTTRSGEEIGIRLAGGKHLHDQDILFEDEDKLILVNVKEVDSITYYSEDVNQMVKFAYLVGNRHAPLFYEAGALAIPYDKPMLEMLSGKGFDVERKDVKLMHLMEGHTHHEH